MTGVQMTLAIILIILAVALIVLILSQKNREANAGAIQGATTNSENDFFDSTSADDTLANATKILGIIFFAVALATVLISLHK